MTKKTAKKAAPEETKTEIPDLDLQDYALLHAALENFQVPGGKWRVIGKTMMRLENKIRQLRVAQEEKTN